MAALRPVFLLGLALSAAALAAACTTERRTAPSRTASEQLMLSSAVDRAVQNLSLRVPHGARVFVDATWFEGTDNRYAVAAIRERLLRRGARLTANREDADMIVEIRSGALSIDENALVVGIPQMEVPIPLAGSFAFPEIALFKRDRRQGIAKFAAVGYDAKTGELISVSDIDMGFSEQTQWNALFVLSWTTNDILPEQDGPVLRPPPDSPPTNRKK